MNQRHPFSDRPPGFKPSLKPANFTPPFKDPAQRSQFSASSASRNLEEAEPRKQQTPQVPTTESSSNRPRPRPCLLPTPAPAATPIFPAVSRDKHSESTIASRKKRTDYADFFERVERVLTLENAKDELVVQNVGKLYNLTLQLLEECRGEGAKNDEDAARMDAYGTQLWNVAVQLLQNDGDSDDDVLLSFIASIRRIAALQLQIASETLGIEYRVASRLINVLSHTALSWLTIDIKEALPMLHKCSGYLAELQNLPVDQSGARIVAAEALTTYHCIKFVSCQFTKVGLPDDELNRAIKSCAYAKSGSWAFNETIRHCIERTLELTKDSLNDQESSNELLSDYKKATHLLQAALQLMGKHTQYSLIKCKAMKILAQCQYQIACKTSNASYLTNAEQTLIELEKALEGQDRTIILSRCLLLRIEIMEQKNTKPEDMMNLWCEFAQLKDIRPSDINHIIQILASREDQNLLDGSYAFDVMHLIIVIVLSQGGGESQTMIGKLLLALIEGSNSPDRISKMQAIFETIDTTPNFRLKEDIGLSCQTSLFQRGDHHGEVEFFQLAGHHLFSSLPVNIAKAWRRAAWQCILNKNYESAYDMLQNVPPNSVEMSSTYLAYCLIHIRQQDEKQAIKSLEALQQANDFNGETLPLIIKEAQEVRMTHLATEALSNLELLFQVGCQGGDNAKIEVLSIIRTILKLQIDSAEMANGFTMDTCVPFISTLERAVKVIEDTVEEGVDSDKNADIATWIFKQTYNVSHDEKHIITPEFRKKLSSLALDLFYARSKFTKLMDDECYQVRLWVCFHILSYRLVVAEKIAVEDQDRYFDAWAQIFEACQDGLNFLHEAEKHNCGATASFQGVATALQVILVDALTKLKIWDKLLDHLEVVKQGSSIDAVEGMADIVASQEDAPLEIRESFAKAALEKSWDSERERPTDIVRMSEWLQRLVLIYAQVQQPGWAHKVEQTLMSVVKTIDSKEVLRRIWPRDSLQWMSSTAWTLGNHLVANHETELGEGLYGIAIRLAELDGTCKTRLASMNNTLDAYKRNKQAAQQLETFETPI